MELNSKRQKFILRLLSIVSLTYLVSVLYKTPNILEKTKILDFSFRSTNAEKCDFNERVIRRVNYPFNGIAIEVSCPFLDRVRVFNAALDHLRLAHLKRRHSKEWANISALENIRSIDGANHNFLQRLGNVLQIDTVFLPWEQSNNISLQDDTSFEDTKNILLSRYYEWTADKELCQWIDRPGGTKVYSIRNQSCNSDIQKTEHPQPLHPCEIHTKPLCRAFNWPKSNTINRPRFHDELPPFAFYMHIIEDCIVTPYSEVWSGDIYLAQHTCHYRQNKTPPQNIDTLPLYDEVMALSQLWGHAVYHAMIDVIPRLSLYTDFLRRNPQIKILATRKQNRTMVLFKILGISKNRIITGICRAKLLYLPRPTKCGCANIQEIQVTSLTYRNFLNAKLKTGRRDKIILISRSGERKFAEHESIERMLNETAAAQNLSFELFPDNPVPSLKRTMIMFHSALMVVAPHGAGLSNVVFSQPGTYVIEGVCNPPYVNLCYRRLSHVLGHHWHGLHSRGGCKRVVNVSTSSLKATVETYLEYLQK